MKRTILALLLCIVLYAPAALSQALIEPTPSEVRGWMDKVGAQYHSAVKEKGSVFVSYTGGNFGGVPTATFIFIFSNPQRAGGVMITFLPLSSEQACNQAVEDLCTVAEELTKDHGKPGTGSDKRPEFAFNADRGVLIVTSMRTELGYSPQIAIIWGPKGRPA